MAGGEEEFVTQLVEALGDPGWRDRELGRDLLELVAVREFVADQDLDRPAPGREVGEVDG